MIDFTTLQSTLRSLDHHFKVEAGKSVNQLMTMRNWLFGFYIVEFEQNGTDRATYGAQILENLSKALKQKNFSHRNLRLYRQFYFAYPQFSPWISEYLLAHPIWQSVIAKLQKIDGQSIEITEPLLAQSSKPVLQTAVSEFSLPAEKLLASLSYTHAYLNYFKESIKTLGDQPPVGLLLCTSKNDSAVRYALGGLDEQLFVSHYKLLLPDEAMLRAFLERERAMIGA